MSNTTVTKDGNTVVVKSSDGTISGVVSVESTSAPSVTIINPDFGSPANIINDGNIVVVKSTSDTTTAIIVEQPDNSIISVNTPGPQGATGPAGSSGNFDASALVTTSSFNTFTSSYYVDSSSFNSRINNITTASLATTGSNIFRGNQIITGSVDITGSLTVNTVNVGQNTINFIDNNKNIVNSISVSGSTLVLASGSISTANGGLTGSLFGTSSWAINYNESDPIFVARSGSFVTTSSFNSFTGSYKNDSSSFDSRINNINVDTSFLVTTSSFNNFTSSYNTGSFTGSFIGLVNSASYALTASYALNAGGISTLIDSIGARVYTDDTFITAGSKGYKHIPYNADIVKTRTIANTNGYIDINIKRNGTTLGTISLSNQSSSLDTTLTGWTTQLNTNDLIEFYVSQSSTYITDISIFIDIQSQ